MRAETKTCNSRDSPIITRLTASPPLHCFNIAESYVKELLKFLYIECKCVSYIYLATTTEFAFSGLLPASFD